jgi:hypothetical protein
VAGRVAEARRLAAEAAQLFARKGVAPGIAAAERLREELGG